MASDQDNTEALLALKSEVEGKTVSEPQIIPVDFVSASGKLIKAINSTDSDFSFSMKDEDYEIKIDRPIYVTEIKVVLGDFDDVKGMKLAANDVLTNKLAKVTITVEKTTGKTVRFILNATITSFTLQRGGFFSKKLKKIEIYGVLPEDFEKFESEYRGLTETKDEILSLAKENIEFINRQIQELDTNRKENEEEVLELQEESATLTAENAALKQTLNELKDSIKQLEGAVEAKKEQDAALTARSNELEKRRIGTESELAQKTETLSNVNINISKAEDKLKSLVNNVNVFSEEFSGFVDQGRKQVETYIGLALIPLILLSVVVYNLFQGAVDLSLKFEKIPAIDLLTLFTTRLPFVAISALIVGVSVKVFFFLVNRIIAIHQQRLDLAKIAIIAKDVSDASAVGLQISADELYEAKTYLKMNILKAYLSDQISAFSYAIRKKEPPSNENTKNEESFKETETPGVPRS